MKTIAEEEQLFNAGRRANFEQFMQRRAAVVGRQQKPAPRKMRPFFRDANRRQSPWLAPAKGGGRRGGG